MTYGTYIDGENWLCPDTIDFCMMNGYNYRKTMILENLFEQDVIRCDVKKTFDRGKEKTFKYFYLNKVKSYRR